MLLLLFNGTPFPAVPLADLAITAPSGTHGSVIQRPATTGAWRWVLELADPAAETVRWHDITDYYAGDRHQFGADDYMGKARARLVSVQLQADDDRLAPWGQDTSSLFGVNVPLDAGLIMRASMARVVSGVTVEWLPIWTGRVERWGDASAARGRIRTHQIDVIDTMSDLANVPVLIDFTTDSMSAFRSELLTQAGWQFGDIIEYGDEFGGGPVIETAQPAINVLDAVSDPLGVGFRSLRSGQLIVHPLPWDTTNVDRYDNPLLDVYPGGLRFSYTPDFTDIEYIADDDQQPFGLERNIAGILNYFSVTMPVDMGTEVYLNDDPVSITRFGVRPFTATWILSNPPVVDDLLEARANASQQALPLRTTIDHEGFWSALAIVDHLDPVTIVHQTRSDGLVVTATGWVRNVVEERTWRGDGGLSWQSTVQVDVAATGTSEALLPVENLAFLGSDSPLLGTSSWAEFSWTNPEQPSITPTDVQYRVLDKSRIWVTRDYPGEGSDGQTVYNLEPATSYRFQVRLIRRVDGVVTNYSIWKEIRFTTAARIYPVPTPGTDPGDTDVIGTPPDDECDDFQVDLQENDGTGWTTVDTFTDSELTPNGDGTYSLTTPIPNSFFNEGSIYRFRSSCDGVTWTVGPSFDPPDDWTDPCTVPPVFLTSPYNDAVVFVPKICAPDIISEAVSGIAGVKGDAYADLVAGLTDPESRALLAVGQPTWDGTFGIVAYGECPQIVGVTGDKSIGVRCYLTDVTEDVILFECAGMTLKAVATMGGWRATVIVYLSNGSTVTMPSSTVLDAETEYFILATRDLESGDVILYVDLVSDNTVGGTDDVPTIEALPIWRLGAAPDSWVTEGALWDRVLVPADFGGVVTPVTVTINQGSGQSDPASASPIVFDVVFSEAVTGFATGDVTLSGTAGAVTGTVVDSGDHIHFTVNVTGMTGGGTVIASIGASVCRSIATDASNSASTSTDNTVTYLAPVAGGLWAHYDASEASSITASAGAVSQWDDLSGNGRHVGQSSGPVKPTTGAATVNGLNVLTFDGSDRLVGLTTHLQPAKPTFYAVVAVDSNVPVSHFIAEIRASSVNQERLWLSRSDSAIINKLVYEVDFAGAGHFFFSDWAYSAGTAILVYGAYDGSNMVTRTNTDSDTTAGAGSQTPGSASNLTIGNGASSHGLIGKLCELLIYDADHGSATRALIAAYLQNKWGAL